MGSLETPVRASEMESTALFWWPCLEFALDHSSSRGQSVKQGLSNPIVHDTEAAIKVAVEALHNN